MKKTLLALLLTLAMVVCFCAFTVSADEETAHEHCVCNGTVSGNDAHTCESVTWTPISEALEEAGLTTETANFGMLPSGNYYLDTDIKVTATNTIGSFTNDKDSAGTTIDRTYTTKEIAICLNGHNITTTSARVFGNLYYGSKLTITDCSGKDAEGNWGGTIEAGTSTTGTVIYTYAGSTFEIYGGNFVSREDVTTTYGLFCIACDNYKEADGKAGLTSTDQQHADNRTFFRVFDGKFVGGNATKSGATIVFWHNAQAYIYNGLFIGGYAKEYGGNFSMAGAASTMNIYGGTFTGGESGWSGGNIYISAGKMNIYGGTFTDGVAGTTGGNIAAGAPTYIKGATISGGTAATHGGDISWLNNTASTVTLDDAFGTLDVGGYAHGGLALTENFSAEKITTSCDTNYGVVVKSFTDESQLACLEAEVEGETLKTINGRVYLYKGEDGKHYACYCGGAYATYHKSVGHVCTFHSDWKDLGAYLAEQNLEAGTQYKIPGGRYYLTSDLTLDIYLIAAADQIVSIDLNGYTLTGGAQPASGTDIPLLRAQKDGEMNICDSSYTPAETAAESYKGSIEVTGVEDYSMMYVNGSGLVRIYGGKLLYTGTQHRTGMICTSGEIRMFNGYINGGKSNGQGASVCVYDSGLFVLWSGHVDGGETSGNGGNFYIDKDSGKLIVSGGIISGGKANKGGNIYASRGTVTINGGLITEGHANDRGGNIYIHGGWTTSTDSKTGNKSFVPLIGNLIMKDGVVSNGTAGKQDDKGNPTSGSGGNVTIFGQYATQSIITDGVTSVVEKSVLATFTMTGGTISGGKAYTAGNVDVYGTMVMDGGLITDGTAGNEGGNMRVYYVKDYDAEGKEFAAASFTMNGGEITKGYAAGNGGGVLTYGITNLNGGKITNSESAKMAGNLRPFRPAIVTIGKDFEISGGKAGTTGGNIALGGMESTEAGAWPFWCFLTIEGTVIDGTAAMGGTNIHGGAYTDITLNGATTNGSLFTANNGILTVTGATTTEKILLGNHNTDEALTVNFTGLTGTAPITVDAYVPGTIATATEQDMALLTAVEGKTLSFNEGNVILDAGEAIEIATAAQLTEITVEPYSTVTYAINSQLNGQYLYIERGTSVTVILNGEKQTYTKGIYYIELTGTPSNQLIVTNTGAATVTMVAEINYLKGSEGNPYVITDASELTSVKAGAGETTYYAINSMLNGMTLTVVSAEGVTVAVNGVELAADANGLITVTLTGAPMNKVAITNAGEEAVELVAALEWPLGSQNNPIVINTAAELTTVEAGKYYAISAMLNGNFIVIEEAAGVVTLNGTALTAEYGYYVAELTGAPMNMLTATATAAAEIVPEAPVFEEPIEKFDIDVARMVLGNALEFQFGVAMTKIPDTTGYYAVIEKTWADGANTTKTIPATEWGTVGPYWAISYDGLAAKEMSDTFYVTVYNAKGQAISNAKVDSVRDYVMRNVNSQTTILKTLMVNMLNYGADAQVNFEYGTNDLANKLLTDTQKAWATTEVAALSNDLVKGTNYMGTRLVLESRIQLQVAFMGMTRDMYAIYTFTDNDGKEQNVRVEGADFVDVGILGVEMSALVYADARSLVEITVYNADDTVYGTATDSIEGYAARNSSNVVVMALMKFADSAKAYLYPNAK